MKRTFILNGLIINEGQSIHTNIVIANGRIDQIGPNLSPKDNDEVINAAGKWVLPGVIDDQVHFREPGLTHKAEIYTESRAAAAGGITSFMEMPNTVPNALTQELLEDKYQIGAARSLVNYSFFMGTSNDNLEELKKTDPKTVCGIKIFMGSSTGNMLVDDLKALEAVFSETNLLIATHCEDEETVRNNMALYQKKYGDNIPFECHPEIRNEEACYKSSSMAVELAKKHHTRLHILHISTGIETDLFDNSIPLKDKHITSEVCVHHLYFNKDDYQRYGSGIKCNPAIKTADNQQAIWKALLDDRLDIIATDHAPHTWEEKSNLYPKAPAGVPLIQHSLPLMLEFSREGLLSKEKVVEKMCHAPAICFQLQDRGFIREGYWADLVIVDPQQPLTVSKENVLYKCGWSPFEGKTFQTSVTQTIVNGEVVYNEGEIIEAQAAQRLTFDR